MTLDKLIIIVGIIITTIAIISYTYFTLKFNNKMFRFLFTLNPKDILHLLLSVTPLLLLMYFSIWLIHLLY